MPGCRYRIEEELWGEERVLIHFRPWKMVLEEAPHPKLKYYLILDDDDGIIS